MELINQHTKKIMEGCKERARDAGLRFQDETLEYIVTNKDLLELSPKNMIPTLYDYWVHDVEVLQEKGRYEIYPSNPYETVINTRPAISFYNDNNPDWLNVMIFYHVLAHIDFFQNNHLFRHTRDEDFAGQALSDKRLIAMLRSEKGRWVDYVIEFTRGIDNLVNIFGELSSFYRPAKLKSSKKTDYYFDVFLQSIEKVTTRQYLEEIDRYNSILKNNDEMAESIFFSTVTGKHPEFETLYSRHKEKEAAAPKDIIQYLIENSSFLKKNENQWMTSIMEIVRNTSLYFQPQVRTKILNEGWASYWHEKLFMGDDRIKGSEIPFARVNALVTALPRAGLNPYALGMRLFTYAEELADKGKLFYDFQKIREIDERKKFDRHTGTGQDFIFSIRENFSDFMFINTFVDQAFVDTHKLFVVGKRLNESRGTWEYYVKSRHADEYKAMILDALYHPPHIEVDESKMNGNGGLYLNHFFEGKPLVRDYIANTMLGIEYLWGAPVHLETTELTQSMESCSSIDFMAGLYSFEPETTYKTNYKMTRVLYTMENKKLSRKIL